MRSLGEGPRSRWIKRVLAQVTYAYLIGFAIPHAFAQTELRPDLLEGLKTTVVEITKRYPPDRFFYVGIGGSPTPIIALMQEAGLDAASIPVSRTGALVGLAEKDSEYRERLFQHLDNFLPPPGKLGNRRLLVMDFAYSGGALVNFKECLDYYTRLRRPGMSWEVLALVYRTVTVHLEKETPRLRLPESVGEELTNNSGFKQVYREYPSWTASDRVYLRPQLRSQYLELRRQLREALKRDINFGNKLHQLAWKDRLFGCLLRKFSSIDGSRGSRSGGQF